VKEWVRMSCAGGLSTGVVKERWDAAYPKGETVEGENYCQKITGGGEEDLNSGVTDSRGKRNKKARQGYAHECGGGGEYSSRK